jgi:hypothetical protein
MNPPVISKSEIKNIFSEIEVILNYNVMLLNELEKRMDNWSQEQIIGDIFLKITDFLKVYTQYVNNYNRAIHTMHSCEKNEKFSSFLLVNFHFHIS